MHTHKHKLSQPLLLKGLEQKAQNTKEKAQKLEAHYREIGIKAVNAASVWANRPLRARFKIA